MGYKTTDEMLNSFKRFADNFKEVKSSFTVHPDYLIDKMSEAEFNNGYEEYRKLMLNLQVGGCHEMLRLS